MAKKAQQNPSAPAKKNAVRTPPAAGEGMKRGTQEVAATEATTSGTDTERPASGTLLRAVAPEQVAAADESAQPSRWPNLPPSAREVLELYEQRASELCFPGVTFESLVAQADRIDQLSDNVEKAKLELAAAEAAKNAAETEFVEATRRAFAYALVYAQEHAELRTELDSFAYAHADKPRRKKREAPETQPRAKRAAKGAAGEAPTAGEAEG